MDAVAFILTLLITLIDKTDLLDPLKREDYWRCTLCTMATYGLNVEGSV